MSDDLNELIDACMNDFGGAGEVGRNLAGANIATDDMARKWQAIRQALQDSRDADWSQIHLDGLSILREESKDLLALWAVLAPLPVVQKRGFDGVRVSVRACNRFLSTYWDSMFPTLPDGLNYRVSILSRLVNGWTGFAKQATPEESDAQAVADIAGDLTEFEELIKQRLPVEKAPPIGELKQLIEAFRKRFQPDDDVDDETEPSADADGATDDDQSDEQRTGIQNHDNELEQGLAEAVRLLRSRPQQALQDFGALVDQQRTLASRFRGRVYLAELCLQAGQTDLARQILLLLDEEREKITLADWEPQLCGRLWAARHKAIAAEEGGDGQKMSQELFAQVCKVDAKQAVDLKIS